MSDDAATLMQNQKIILFDAQCKLCSAWCNFIINNDVNTIFRLCSVQSPKGELLLAHFGFSTIEYASMVYLENGKAYTQSHAFFNVVKQLGYPYKLATVFSILPARFNNWLYNRVALNRYTLFGKYQYCRIPNPEDAKHYL